MKMRILIKFMISVILSYPLSSFAQLSSNQVSFDANSCSLSDEARTNLDSIAIAIADEQDGMNVIFDVYGYATADELKKNPSIGILRAKAVIDFMVEKWKFRHEQWRIVYLGIDSPTIIPASAAAISSGCIRSW